MKIIRNAILFAHKRYILDDESVISKKPKIRQAESPEDIINSNALFLITPGRSGTKSLVEYCKKHTNLYSVHAPTPWLASVGYMYHQGKIGSEAAQIAFYSSREKYLLNAFERGIIFFDGDCKNLPLSLEIGSLMPNSKFIHVVRNPRSFIKSGIARGYYKDKPCALWGHLSQRGAETFTQVEKIAFFWNEANLIAENAKEEFGRNRVQTIVADKMFDQPSLIDETLSLLGFENAITGKSSDKLEKQNAQRNKIDINDNLSEEINRAIDKMCPTMKSYF